MEETRFCIHCNAFHPLNDQHWEYRRKADGELVASRCKAYRRQVYHSGGGKDKAKGAWLSKGKEERDKINARRRELYKAKKEVDKDGKAS